KNFRILMIFGFNTDVKHGDTIYHVQSEARESEKLLQTQVFVRGRCIGKKAISYANSAAEAGLGDPQKEQQLRDQHRLVLEPTTKAEPLPANSPCARLNDLNVAPPSPAAVVGASSPPLSKGVRSSR